MNYTPGPWAMKSADSRHIGEPYRAVEITSSKSGLAYQWATVHGDDRVANARLIAAAPELLEHLIWIANHDGECVADWPRRLAAMRADIARATGAIA